MDSLKGNSSMEVQAGDGEQEHKVNVTCEEPLIFVRGTNVSLRGVFDELTSKSRVKDDCAGVKTAGKFNALNVFALDTVYIDQDIPFNGIPKMNISVIAPRWEIMDTVRIDLNGTVGKSVCDRGSSNCRARDGSGLTIKGTDGEPGGPGGLGRTFFGIGEEFTNGSNLTITVDGGPGGAGQDGGNGKDGSNGRDAFLPKDVTLNLRPPTSSEVMCGPSMCKGGERIHDFRCEQTGHRYTNWYSVSESTIRIFGDGGSRGGDGGDGGKGGKGGSPGAIYLFQLGDKSQIPLSHKEGVVGEGGKGGTGGRGGYNGNDILARCTLQESGSEYSHKMHSNWYLMETKPNGRASSGKNGAYGKKDRNVKDKEQQGSPLKPALVLNTYKRYLRENLKNHNEASSLIKFHHRLDTSEDIKNIYDTLALFDELQGIEEQFHDLNKDVDLLPFYQSLLVRIKDYAESPKQGENSNEHKKVLNYLYTATLGRIYNLKDNSESSLIIHVAEYLDDLRVDIESLKEMQKTRNKMDIIERYKKEYKSNIDQKIKEAESLIEKLITPEIENAGKRIDNSVELLMNETLELQKQAKVEKQVLIDKRKELENAMALGILFSVFKFAGEAISTLGPVGATAGLAIGTSTSIAETLLLDQNTGPGEALELPKGIISNLQSLEQKIKAVRDKKVARLNALLEEILKESNQYPEHLNDTKAKVAQIKENLNKLDDNVSEFTPINTLEEALKQILERKKIELNSQKILEDKKAKRAKAVIEKFEQAAKLGGIVLEAYNQYKNDKQRLDLMSDAIQQAEDKFMMLKEYEEKIYTTITPILQNMKDDLNETARQLKSKSRVSLDVTKWQIQGSLRDMKSQMQKITEGFEVKGDFLSGIEQLEEAMNALIKIYDHIQNYQEQQNLANYIADISSAAANDINITDPDLIKADRELGIITKSNLVLQRYKTAIDAFKQFVFPFAHLYLEEMEIPSHLKPGNDVQSLISKVSDQIKDLKSKLHKYAQSIEKQDRYIGWGEFTSRYISTAPFFVWKNEQNKDMISNLLSGREVLVTADIMTSDIHNKDAVKFNVIELNFISKNKTLQSEINYFAQGFEVRAIHLGDSYYRFDNKIYLIATNSHVIEFNIEKKPDGTPVHVGGVYEKIKNGDFMLSPYASWQITLFSLTNKISFEDLLQYKDEIDLELAGEGHYVKNRELAGLNLHMEKYYKTIYECDLIDHKARDIKPENASLVEESTSTDWFSWMSLPIFSILPGAEASDIENDFVNRKEYIYQFNLVYDVEKFVKHENFITDHQKDVPLENSVRNIVRDDLVDSYSADKSGMLLDYAITPFINCVKLLKDVVSSKLPARTTKSYSSKSVLVNYADFIAEDTPNSTSNNMAISFNGDTDNNVGGSSTSSMDVIGNLTLAQLLVQKVFGTNECLRNTYYLSPTIERAVRVDQLASEVLPILKGNYPCADSDWDGAYDAKPQWYRDLCLNDEWE